MVNKLKDHFQDYVARYATAATAVLVPIAGLLGSLAADLGGADTKAGHIVLMAASAVGTALAAVVFIRNLGIWQMLDSFGVAPNTQQATLPPALAAAEVATKLQAATSPSRPGI